MKTHITDITCSEFIKLLEQIHALQKYNMKEEELTSWTQIDYSTWWQKTVVLAVLVSGVSAGTFGCAFIVTPLTAS